MDTQRQDLVAELAELLERTVDARAVVIGGSAATGSPDASSDIDLYVFVDPVPSATRRRAIVEELGGASRADLGLDLFGPGDEWVHGPTGIHLDVMWWSPDWITDQLDRVLLRHEPSLGYSTAFWHTVRTSRPMLDREGWYAALQARAAAPYPEPLRRAVIGLNHAILRDTISSFRGQVAKAVERGDPVSVNHRVAALVASYFDVVFAANRVPHPGEKRLLALAPRLCRSLPEGMDADLRTVLGASGAADAAVLDHLDRLLDRLDGWLGPDLPAAARATGATGVTGATNVPE